MRIVNRVAAAKNDEGGSSFITTSGIYPMRLKGIELAGTDSGAVQANYYFDKVMSFGNYIISSSAKGNKELFGFLTLDALAVIEDIETYANTPDELTELELQLKDRTKTVMVIPEFEDIDVLVHVQYSYELYQGDIKERVAVKRFYRTSDNATSSEIVDETEPGKKFAADSEKYASNVVYGEGLDEEQVAAWKESKKTGGAAPKKDAAKKAGFGKRKGFGIPAAQQ